MAVLLSSRVGVGVVVSWQASAMVKPESSGSSMTISSWTWDNLVPSLSDECHGVDEEVTSDCLDDVLDEFPAVDLQPPPLASGCDTAVGPTSSTPM